MTVVDVPRLFLEVAGQEIRTLRRGDGPPVVVFHHSFGSPGWLAFYEQLSAGFDTLVPDLPGFAGSPQPPWARHPRDLSILLGWWLRKLELGPVTLVGCGFGGWVAAELSTMAPELVSNLVLVGAAGLLPEKGRILDQILISHSEYVQAAFKHRESYEAIYGTGLPDDLLISWDENREMMTRVAWKPYMYNRRLVPLLSEIAFPTLIVWGDEDNVVPLECGQQYQRLIPGSKLEIVPDCGHAVDMERPAALAALIATQLSPS
jgi:pimeloyl-ACP methyl ester carboxylesterase